MDKTYHFPKTIDDGQTYDGTEVPLIEEDHILWDATNEDLEKILRELEAEEGVKFIQIEKEETASPAT